MGVAVLLPEEILRSSLSRNQNIISSPSKPRRRSSNRSGRRKLIPIGSPPPPAAAGNMTKTPLKRQVRILKRGEELSFQPTPSQLTPSPTVSSTLEPPSRVTPSIVGVETIKGEDKSSVLYPNSRSDRFLKVGRKENLNLDGFYAGSGKENLNLDGFYAGSGFAASPPPSSLPMPAVIGKKKISGFVNDDKASMELRRILQLDD
ncbi:hypothetical protein Dimus_019400 [Dionaea muscipula]